MTYCVAYKNRNHHEPANSIGPRAATHDHATADAAKGCQHSRLSVVLCPSTTTRRTRATSTLGTVGAVSAARTARTLPASPASRTANHSTSSTNAKIQVAPPLPLRLAQLRVFLCREHESRYCRHPAHLCPLPIYPVPTRHQQ